MTAMLNFHIERQLRSYSQAPGGGGGDKGYLPSCSAWGFFRSIEKQRSNPDRSGRQLPLGVTLGPTPTCKAGPVPSMTSTKLSVLNRKF